MSEKTPTSDRLRSVDRALLLSMRVLASREGDAVGISQLTEHLGVTATAVRQRIDRLLEMGLIEREKVVRGRGRPTYRYRLTVDGHHRCGANPADMVDAMWRELMAIPDPTTRDQVLANVAKRMGRKYAAEISAQGADDSLPRRVEQLSQLMAARQVAVEVIHAGNLPVLDICSCPYPTLTDGSDQRAMCQLEEQMISEALGQTVQLTSCCLDGDNHCQFTATNETVS